MAGRVVIVGSVNVDLVVVAPRLPGPGETVTGGDVARHHGGKGGNQAVAAARLGAPVAFVGAVGDDDFGLAARAALAGEGIDVTHLAATARPTGVALIVVDARAENLIAVAPGANASPTAASVTAALAALAVGPGDVVLASREVPPDAVRAALATARAAGAVAMLNPAPADGLDAATIALADVLTPNGAELALLAAASDGDAAASEMQAGAGMGQRFADAEASARRLLAGGREDRAIVVTLGAAGALVVPAVGPAIVVPAVQVAPLDTTGAGDAFSGALAVGLAAGLPLVEAAGRAAAAAGLSTTRAGARGGMPTAAELAAFLGE
ncbi:MAG: ribokinase [Chloroflexota bacterium]